MNIKIREPNFNGQFYPDSKEAIEKQIKTFTDKKQDKINALGCILPHAGYIYSGKVAVETVSCIEIKNTVVLLGPNHTGEGVSFSIMTDGVWKMPSGDVEIDNVLAKNILDSSKCMKNDFLAHKYEHSLEVELPILQYFKDEFKIVPIAIMSSDMPILKEIGEKIAEVIKKTYSDGSVTIIASSDMTHYEPYLEAKRKDNFAIEAILSLDEDLLASRISEHSISMCGYAPVTVLISAIKHLGGKKAKLVKYETSAEANNDRESVVGYAGVVFY